MHSNAHLHGHLAAVAAPTPQFAVVTVPPGPHHVIISQAQRLGIAAAARHVDDAVALQSIHLETHTEQPPCPSEAI